MADSSADSLKPDVGELQAQQQYESEPTTLVEADAPAPQSVQETDTLIPDAPPYLAPQAQAQAQSVVPPTALPSAATPVPRTATPKKEPNGTAETTAPMPTKAASHGAPARRYLNEKVTGVLLEGMKRLASEQWVLSMQFGKGEKLIMI
ncbi:MAG: COMPASS (complex proteins associated with Set1p) component [Ramalina farinacea]|uniref:COMPASS (Complex proteins associated with Set1p) component n=1 Tax=Ramalina farinacea TaxID=258253 RepID=A0AA43QKS0_9LECA|nr:COMPASS (complex proteins associated with Set1p) component [Ramalina farinacea]